MRYVITLLALSILGFVVYFDRLNQQTITVKLTSNISYSISMVGFFLLSFAFGAFIILLFTLFRDARNVFQEWRNRQKAKLEARIQEIFSRGLYAYFSGKTDQAISFFRDILKLNPNHFYALLRIGDIYAKERNYTEAIKFHKRAKKIEEKSLEATYALVDDYVNSESYDAAISLMQDTIKKDNANIEALTRLRDIYIKTEKWDGAHEIQGRILKHRKDNTDDTRLLMALRYEFAKSLYHKGDKEKGKKLLKGIIKSDKEFVPAFVTLGEFMMETGEGSEAVDIWEKGYYMNHSEILLHKLEDYYLQLGKPENIIWTYKKAISQNPGYPVLKFYLGKLYYRLEMLDEAFETLSELEGVDSGMPDLHKLLGNIYERKEDLERAIQEFKKALGLRKRIMVPYYCPLCDYHTFTWSGRCPRCGEWNTFTVSPLYIERGRKVERAKSSLQEIDAEQPYRESVEWSGV